MDAKDISEGCRIAFLYEHKKWAIEVATGYDVTSDRWPVHVYVTPPAGSREKIQVHVPVRDSQAEALTHGYETGKWYVEHFTD